jgi:hypothetical protein
MHYAMKLYGWVGVQIQVLFDLRTSCRWVISFTPLLLYPGGKSLLYPLDRRLDGLQSPSGRHGEHSSLYRDSNSDPSAAQAVASPCIDCAIPAPFSTQSTAIYWQSQWELYELPAFLSPTCKKLFCQSGELISINIYIIYSGIQTHC